VTYQKRVRWVPQVGHVHVVLLLREAVPQLQRLELRREAFQDGRGAWERRQRAVVREVCEPGTLVGPEYGSGRVRVGGTVVDDGDQGGERRGGGGLSERGGVREDLLLLGGLEGRRWHRVVLRVRPGVPLDVLWWQSRQQGPHRRRQDR
jgi:hypothetical protein